MNRERHSHDPFPVGAGGAGLAVTIDSPRVNESLHKLVATSGGRHKHWKSNTKAVCIYFSAWTSFLSFRMVKTKTKQNNETTITKALPGQAPASEHIQRAQGQPCPIGHRVLPVGRFWSPGSHPSSSCTSQHPRSGCPPPPPGRRPPIWKMRPFRTTPSGSPSSDIPPPVCGPAPVSA